MRASADDVGAGERVRVRAVGGGEADVRVLVLEQQRVPREGLLEVDHRVQRLVVDDDGFGRVGGEVGIGGDHGGHDVAHEAHLAPGQRRALVLRSPREADVVGQVQVVGRVDGQHAGHRLGLGRVDGAESAVGDVGADEHDVRHAVDLEVVEVLVGAGEQAGVLLAQDAVPEDRTGLRHGHPPRCRSPVLHRPAGAFRTAHRAWSGPRRTLSHPRWMRRGPARSSGPCRGGPALATTTERGGSTVRRGR